MTILNAEKSFSATNGAASSTRAALTMVTTLFFLWGFITCLNDILIPHLKSLFTLNYAEVMLIQTFFFSAYFIFALPSGWVISRIGYKWTMVAGLLVMAVGAVLFVPAANTPSFALFLVALGIIAAGMTFLQVSANPYVIMLGPPKSGSSRLNLAQAFNSLGTTIAPYIGGLLILGSIPLGATELSRLSQAARHTYRLQQAAVVKQPYIVIAIILVSFAIAMTSFRLPKLAQFEESAGLSLSSWREIRKQRHLVLAVVAIFLYVGAEVSIGSFLVSYLSQPDIGGMMERVAAGYVTFYWGGAMVGRFTGAAVTRRLSASSALSGAAILACGLVITSICTSGHIAMWSLILVGLFNSIMWPCIFALGLAELGPLANLGSSLLVSAVIGGAMIPLLQGIVADRIGIHHSFCLPALCYLYVYFYGAKGSKKLCVGL